MALLNAVVLQSKEGKGGRNKVRISVAHNGETRYIVTDIILNSSKEFKNGTVVKRPDASLLNVKIRGLLQRYQSALDELDYIDGLTCPELVFQLKNSENYKHRTLKSIFEEYMEKAHIRPGTATGYRYIWNTIRGHLGEKLLAEHVTHGTLLGLDKYLRDRGLKLSTIRNYLAFFMVLISYAKRCGYVQFRVDPFFGYHLPQQSARESWISVEEVRRIRDLKTSRKNIMKCRDIFMLSYYLGGINITDLLDINFDEHPGVLRYVRKKTERCPKMNKFVEFDIPDEAKALIEKWKGDDGRLAVTNDDRNSNMRYFFFTNMKKLAELTD